jgi:MFS transporter, OFA family, oxalate/formate antiporter
LKTLIPGKIFAPGVKVVIAGSTINFCLGIFYAWSVFANGLIKELGWSKSEAMLPYTLELLVFSVAMIFGGRFQDRYGPRGGIMISGIFTGLGLILCALTASPLGIALSFGIVFGSAAAFGYSAVTPAVIRWFPPAKRGLVTGVVLMSLGAAALVWAPLVNLLIQKVGVIRTFFVVGVLLTLVIALAARVISSPPPVVEGQTAAASSKDLDSSWRGNVRLPSFRILWVMIGLSSGIGIMFIGHLVQIADLNFQVSWGYLLVSLFAAVNAAGRLAGGYLCDRLGYIGNLKIALALMTAAMLLFLSGMGWPALVAATSLLGLSYGSMYTSFPTIVGKLYGLKNFGINYGLIFTAVGIVGGLGPLVAAYMAELTGSYYPTFLLGLTASLVCFYLAAALKKYSLPV